MSVSIFPHTVNENTADYNLIPVGTLLLGFMSKNITTKTYKNSVAIVGNSKRNLKDFIKYYTYSDGAILRFYKGQLTTTVPNIYLRDISGVVIGGAGTYLAVNSLGQVINTVRKEYQIKQLSDVVNTVAPNKYALTYNASNEEWYYAPEASALSKFDDIEYELAPIPYACLVSNFAPTNRGGFGNTKKVLPLSIRWDRSPVLGGALNCNGKSLNNLIYNCQNISATQPLSSLIIDTIQHSETNVVCTNGVKVLNIQLVINNNHLKFFTLNLSNFTGIVSFKADADIRFENGYLPKISKPENTYTLLIYKDDVKIKVVILHKNRNMGSFSNGT
jgi:hypothetical protein